MNIEQTFQLAGAVMISLGGASGLLYGLSSLLGKFYLQREKAKIDTLHASLQSKFDKQMSFFERYHSTQFQTYNEIWASLCEVERISENLWVRAQRQDVVRLAEALKSARESLRKASLLIEEADLAELNNLFDEFEDFRFGKFRIVEMREGRGLRHINDAEIGDLIAHNGEIRGRYQVILKKVEHQLRSQIRGERL